MTELASDGYHGSWSPRAYLEQYYSSDSIAADEVFNTRFVREHLSDFATTFRRAIEIGCGPTIHHAAMLLPFVEELQLADYLAGNLLEVRKWLDSAPDAHRWEPYLRGIVSLEGKVDESAVRGRIRELQARVTATRQVDLQFPKPAEELPYDLVASFYCVECIQSCPQTYQRLLSNLCSYLAPQGVLLMSAIGKASSYRVFDETFPAVPIDEEVWQDAFLRLGFSANDLVFESEVVSDWQDHGFEGICCVLATRA
jgi:hypothetical protein